MIYTVTFNPSLDYFVTVDDFLLGRTNRTVTEAMLPGGKGINVSMVLHNLGMETTALLFVAGFTGEEIVRKVGEFGFCCDFISVADGYSRINMKLKDFEGTEINGKGPEIGPEDVNRLLVRLDSLSEGDVLVLAGSIPGGLPDTMYGDICARLSERGVLLAVDATGGLLSNVLEYRPFLVKPNHHELGEIFGVELKTREDAVPYALKLRERGARNVLVSMSGMGAVLAAENGQVYMLAAPKGRVVNAVGAGDSMVAGFLAGWMEKKDYFHAFKLGIAAGSASAFSEELAARADIQRMYDAM